MCSNGGGDDLAPAIDLSSKDDTRINYGYGEECVEVMGSGLSR